MVTIWNPNDNGGVTTGDAGLSVVAGTSYKGVRATEGRSKGKFYFELTFTNTGRYTSFGLLSLAENRDGADSNFTNLPAGSIIYPADGKRYSGATAYANGTGATGVAGVTVGIAMDMNSGKWFFHYDGVWQGGGDPLTGANPVRLLTPGVAYYPYLRWYSSGGTVLANFGASAFKYTPPTGYIAYDLGRNYPSISWCSYKKGAYITLNSDGLTVDANSTASWGSVITNAGKTTGKWYFEFYVIKSSLLILGIVNSSFSASNYIGGDANGCAWREDGYYYSNASNVLTTSTFTTGDTVGIAFDCDAKSASWYKNGVLQFTKTYTLSGEIYPAASLNRATSGGILKANFGGTAFKYPAPAGYSAIDPNQVVFLLLKDGANIKTVKSGSIVDLGAAELTEQLFSDNGVTDPATLFTSPITSTVAATGGTALGSAKLWTATITASPAGISKISKKVT